MGFLPSKLEPDIWMQQNIYIYEYIAVYVDNFLIAGGDTKILMNYLKKV